MICILCHDFQYTVFLTFCYKINFRKTNICKQKWDIAMYLQHNFFLKRKASRLYFSNCLLMAHGRDSSIRPLLHCMSSLDLIVERVSHLSKSAGFLELVAMGGSHITRIRTHDLPVVGQMLFCLPIQGLFFLLTFLFLTAYISFCMGFNGSA